MIEIALTAKHFGDTPVLGAIDLRIARGERVALMGPSGIGKSTLLRIIAGIDPDFQGRAKTHGRIGFVFQEPTLLPWRTILQNLTIVHPDLTQDAARAALRKVGLAGREQAYPGQLSLGQQRRAALARAFAHLPDVLIMDEPFVSLDRETADTMLSLTEDLMNETMPGLLFVTHDLTEADRLADRILTLIPQPEGAVLR